MANLSIEIRLNNSAKDLIDSDNAGDTYVTDTMLLNPDMSIMGMKDLLEADSNERNYRVSFENGRVADYKIIFDEDNLAVTAEIIQEIN